MSAAIIALEAEVALLTTQSTQATAAVNNLVTNIDDKLDERVIGPLLEVAINFTKLATVIVARGA